MFKFIISTSPHKPIHTPSQHTPSHTPLQHTYRLRKGPAGFEDGTLPFLSIAALKHGFLTLERMGGMHAIEQRCAHVTRCVYGAVVWCVAHPPLDSVY